MYPNPMIYVGMGMKANQIMPKCGKENCKDEEDDRYYHLHHPYYPGYGYPVF